MYNSGYRKSDGKIACRMFRPSEFSGKGDASITGFENGSTLGTRKHDHCRELAVMLMFQY